MSYAHLDTLPPLWRSADDAPYTERVLQFGDGNFLRAFLDWQLDILNEHTDLDAGVVAVKPRSNAPDAGLNRQQGLYTVLEQGLDDDGRVVRRYRRIRSLNRVLSARHQFEQVLALAHRPELRWVISNTTEAGIRVDADDRFEQQPPASFPAKLTRWLYERYRHFAGAPDKGVILLPCELIDHNGRALLAAVLEYVKLWRLEAGFADWLRRHNHFCSTLVDRIVSGFPAEEAAAHWRQLGYRDEYLVCAEPFHLLVIEGPDWLARELRLDQLPPERALNIRIVADVTPYKERKVALLNGGHTALVPVAFLCGLNTVGEAMADAGLATFVEGLLREEIQPLLAQPQDELSAFVRSTLTRFANPYLHHALSAIALNGMSKFIARLLPSLLAYRQRHDALPGRLCLALAALLAFYRGERPEGPYPLQDEPVWLARHERLWADWREERMPLPELVRQWLSAGEWGRDLTSVPGLVDRVSNELELILQQGMRAALARGEQQQWQP